MNAEDIICLVRVSIISDSLYEKRIAAPYVDIRKRKSTEKALEDTEYKLKYALEMYWGKWIRRNFEDCSTILRLKMSFVKIFGISANFIKTAEHKDFIHVLSNEIERKLASLDEMEGLPYDKTDIIQLIGLIEMNKIKFLNGDISGDRFYNDVDNALGLFEREHPGFDYLKDPALNVYFSCRNTSRGQ